MTVAALVLAAGGSRRLGQEAVDARGHAVGVCSNDDGLGHPLWFDRSMVETLAGLHGDTAVWKLVDADRDVARIRAEGDNPRDVGTRDDHRAPLEDDR